MKKSLFSFVITAFIVQHLFAQNLQFGPGEKNSDKGFGRVQKSIGVLKNKYLLWEPSFHDITVVKRKVSYAPYLRVFDLDKMSTDRILDLHEIISSSDKDSKNVLVTSVFLWKERVVITYTKKEKGNTDLSTYALLLNDNLQVLSQPVKLYDGINKSEAFFARNDYLYSDYFGDIDINLFNFTFSKDSTKLLTFFTPKKDSTKEVSFRVFDNNLNLLQEINTRIPFNGTYTEILKYKISEEGIVYLLVENRIIEKKPNSQEVLRVSTNIELFEISKKSVKKQSLHLSDEVSINIANFEFQKGQFINCFGTYIEEKDKSRSGIFSIKIDLASFSVIKQSMISILDDIVTNCNSLDKENDIMLRSKIMLQDIWTDENENIFISARDWSRESGSTYVRNGNLSVTGSYFNYSYKIQEDVVLFSINKNAEIHVINCFENFNKTSSGSNLSGGPAIFKSVTNFYSIQLKKSGTKKDSKVWVVYKSFDIFGKKLIEKIIDLPEKYLNHSLMYQSLSVISEHKIALILVNEKKVDEIDVLKIELQ